MASITITIQNRVIEFPISGTDPNWAPALVEFAQAVEDALAGLSGNFDVAPQVLNIDSFNSASNIDIDALIFPVSDVQSATIYYSVYRATDETIPAAGDNEFVSESGQLEAVYNSGAGTWEMSRIGTADANIDFNITSTGQIQFSTTALTGINHTGIISFRAITLTNA